MVTPIPECEYLINSPSSNPWFLYSIKSEYVLIPAVGTNLLLFSYPSPGFSMIICPKTNFLFKLWNLCVPSANPVRLSKFDLVSASFWLFASLIVVLLTLDTK